jgi:glutamate racemase
LLPAESLLYLADQANLPYGEKPSAYIRQLAEAITHFFIGAGCKAMVIPCNTANAAALHYLRQTFPQLPIIGMEPAIKPAVANTKTGIIGVISTRATFQGELLASVVDRYAQSVRVEARACPELVLLAEQGAPDTPAAQAIVDSAPDSLRHTGIDQLVLGCTHFPFLAKHLQRSLGDGVALVDPAPAVAKQLGRVLAAQGLLAEQALPGWPHYLTTADPIAFARVVSTLLGIEQPPVEALQWRDGKL